MTALLPRARRSSRLVVLGTIAGSALLRRRASGGRAEQAVLLTALALGMPHGAADTELLRSAAGGSRTRYGGLAAGYALAAAAATVVVRRGGSAVERAVLLGSAVHFAEGEVACWGDPPNGRPRARVALRLVAAGLATIALPAAVAARSPRSVGPVGRRPALVPVAAAAGAAVTALAVSRDREAAADAALLCVLALVTPPAAGFAAYFGGWHALRHTARVVDALVADGLLPPQRSLPRATGALGRRSAWAVAVGMLGAGVLAAREPDAASDNAFAAVLGLTVPHMAIVGLELSRRGC